MAILRSAHPLIACAGVLVLAGCPAAPVLNPTLPVVDRAGTASPPAPGKEAPDAALLSLARTGVDVANGLGPALRGFAPVLDAIRASRTKHPPTGYRLAQVSGWRFLGGAWLQSAPDGSRSLRATIEDLTGKTPGWDVTLETNYGPDFYPAFPADAVRLRLDVEQTLTSGGRVTASFAGPLGQAGEGLEVSGVGSVSVLDGTGTLGIEALNARIGSNGAVERGDLVLKGLATGTTVQFTSTWSQAGLLTASLYRSAAPAGTLVQTGGRWQIQNDAGSYFL